MLWENSLLIIMDSSPPPCVFGNFFSSWELQPLRKCSENLLANLPKSCWFLLSVSCPYSFHINTLPFLWITEMLCAIYFLFLFLQFIFLWENTLSLDVLALLIWLYWLHTCLIRVPCLWTKFQPLIPLTLLMLFLRLGLLCLNLFLYLLYLPFPPSQLLFGLMNKLGVCFSRSNPFHPFYPSSVDWMYSFCVSLGSFPTVQW